jgi:hypothetical protein
MPTPKPNLNVAHERDFGGKSEALETLKQFLRE